jgi:ribosomal protein L29
MSFIVCFVMLLWLGTLTACAQQPGQLALEDRAEVLERSKIEAAAAPLLNAGHTVAIFTVNNGDETGQDFSQRLQKAGLWRSNDIHPDILAIYVSLTPRYSELRAGSNFSSALPDELLRTIRLEQLNPNLRAGTMSTGVEATLKLFERELNAAQLNSMMWWGFGGICVTGLIAWLTIAPRLADRRWRRDEIAKVGQRIQRMIDDLQGYAQRDQWMTSAQHQRFANLEQQYQTLRQQSNQNNRMLLNQLRDLETRCRTLRDELSNLDFELNRLQRQVPHQAQETRKRIERVQRAFEQASKPSRSSGQKAKTISTEAQQRLSELFARVEQLNQQRLAEQATPLTIRPKIDQLAGYLDGYSEIYEDADRLWQAELPASYKAANQPKPQLQSDASYQPGFVAGASSSSDYSSSSSDYSSSSSDYSSSSSDSGGSSSDGGSW